MSAIHPTPEKIDRLRRRWEGQEARLRAVATALRAGEDWTVHLRGLPYVDEIPPHPGEACGRDLRGADLRRWLVPEVVVVRAGEAEAGIVAAISMEGLRTNTPLPDRTPFPVQGANAEEIAVAMRRGDRLLLAWCDGDPVGAVRVAVRRELSELVGGRAYAELSGLAVLPAWRRAGIGGRLLEAAEAEAREAGPPDALLRTSLEVGLVPWYEARGWRIRQVRQMTFPEAPTFLDVVMTRSLVGATTLPGPGSSARAARISIWRGASGTGPIGL